MKSHPIHEYAKLFPAMDDDKLEELAADIRANGLQNPIWLDSDGYIIDGRNRAAACRIAGIEPETRTFIGTDEDKLHFVCSQNVHRRHLDQSQRAMIAAKLRDSFDALAKIRMMAGNPVENFPQGQKGKSRDQAGAAMNVSGKSVDSATRVIKKGVPEVVQAVEKGTLAVSRAAKIVELPEGEQRAALEAAPTPRKKAEPVELFFATINDDPVTLQQLGLFEEEEDADLVGYAVFLTRHGAISAANRVEPPVDPNEPHEIDAITVKEFFAREAV